MVVEKQHGKQKNVNLLRSDGKTEIVSQLKFQSKNLYEKSDSLIREESLKVKKIPHN